MAYAMLPLRDLPPTGSAASNAGQLPAQVLVWSLRLIPPVLLLPVYVTLAGRLRGTHAISWARARVLLVGALMLALFLFSAPLGAAALCFVGGRLLFRLDPTDRRSPDAPEDSADLEDTACSEDSDGPEDSADLEDSDGPGAVARAEERCRLHRDLHDGLTPVLTGVRLLLDTAARRLDHDPRARTLVEDAAEGASQAMAEARRVIDGLRPADLDKARLPGALGRLAARMTGPTTTVLVVEDPGLPVPLRPATEVAAYRIAAEAVTNAVRHARARRVEIRLRAAPDVLVLDVVDDGVGPAPGVSPRKGTGLVSMARRAADAGGWCAVRAGAGAARGTDVHAELPLSPR
ncbi:histidine kinase [Streptomyces sp. NPDC026672]|uniref:sensor histidine kinase n=1 Tax=unclassified Streptomyces TaxID=2593676 RepID=UPI0033D38752